MAIIKEVIAKNGVHVRIADDCMAKPGTEEYKRVIAEQQRAAYDILISVARRRYEEKQNAKRRLEAGAGGTGDSGVQGS